MDNESMSGTYYFFCAQHPHHSYGLVYFSFDDPDNHFPAGRVRAYDDILKASRFSKDSNDAEFFINKMQAIQTSFDGNNFDLSTLALKRIEMKIEEADEFLENPKWRIFLKENAMKKLTAQEISILKLGDTKMLTKLADDSAYGKGSRRGFFRGGSNA